MSNGIFTMNITEVKPKRVRPNFQPWDGAKTHPNPHFTEAYLLPFYTFTAAYRPCAKGGLLALIPLPRHDAHVRSTVLTGPICTRIEDTRLADEVANDACG